MISQYWTIILHYGKIRDKISSDISKNISYRYAESEGTLRAPLYSITHMKYTLKSSMEHV